MKIWIDLTNSPHINFFKPFIKQWENEGHEIFLTARNLANTIELIQQNSWIYKEIGGHAGKNKFRKMIYFPKRIFLLWKFLKKNKPDIGISHSSFYSPLVCRLLKIPSIYLNDNEHATGNYLAFKFATLNILPESLMDVAINKKWKNKYNVDFYPGIKEGIYLSKFNLIKQGNQEAIKPKVYIRLEPWTAQYYDGNTDFMKPLILELSNYFEINILPRSDSQISYFENLKNKNIIIHKVPLKLADIVNNAYFFLGAGGSMTRELAFLGIPTFSIYQGELLSVDKFLIKNGVLVHNTNPTLEILLEFVKKFRASNNKILIQKGHDAFDFVNTKLTELYLKYQK
jgi:predicted glycosyltransferase